MSIRNDPLHTLVSIIRVECAAMRLVSGCKGGEVALAAVVGHLQVLVAGSLVRRRAQAQMLKAGQRVAGGSLR